MGPSLCPAGTCRARQFAPYGDGCLDGASLAALAESGRLSVGAQTLKPRNHLVSEAFNDCAHAGEHELPARGLHRSRADLNRDRWIQSPEC